MYYMLNYLEKNIPLSHTILCDKTRSYSGSRNYRVCNDC